ncbi:hypothetical protein [Janthinobacterium sp.]|uniref:hypothetical protein n=1 Tax=Janthinobacterium sp. TaxID=1871054 RepID=UPI00260656C3|nr:hypothetical protein [Janthinobacterium sp.]
MAVLLLSSSRKFLMASGFRTGSPVWHRWPVWREEKMLHHDWAPVWCIAVVLNDCQMGFSFKHQNNLAQKNVLFL